MTTFALWGLPSNCSQDFTETINTKSVREAWESADPLASICVTLCSTLQNTDDFTTFLHQQQNISAHLSGDFTCGVLDGFPVSFQAATVLRWKRHARVFTHAKHGLLTTAALPWQSPSDKLVTHVPCLQLTNPVTSEHSSSPSRHAQYYAGLVIQGHNLMIFFAFVFTRFRCQKQNKTLNYLI